MEIWKKDERGKAFLYQIPQDNSTVNSLQSCVTPLAGVRRLERETAGGRLTRHKATDPKPRRLAFYRQVSFRQFEMQPKRTDGISHDGTFLCKPVLHVPEASNCPFSKRSHTLSELSYRAITIAQRNILMSMEHCILINDSTLSRKMRPACKGYSQKWHSYLMLRCKQRKHEQTCQLCHLIFSASHRHTHLPASCIAAPRKCLSLLHLNSYSLSRPITISPKLWETSNDPLFPSRTASDPSSMMQPLQRRSLMPTTDH